MAASVCEQVLRCRTSRYSPLIRRIVVYMMENFTKDIRLDKTAELMAVNKSYLSSLFSKETGYSFTRYLNRIRLEKAAADLRCCNLPIGKIAENAGISDQNYFARIFRLEYGQSPSEYRQSPSEYRQG